MQAFIERAKSTVILSIPTGYCVVQHARIANVKTVFQLIVEWEECEQIHEYDYGMLLLDVSSDFIVGENSWLKIS